MEVGDNWHRAGNMRLTGSGSYARAPRPTMPPGLTELMEDLTKNVLRHNPENLNEFCANHMAKLIEIRDGRPPRKPLSLEQKIQRAQKILKKKVDERRKKYDEEMQAFLQQQKEELRETKENSVVQNANAQVHRDLIANNASEIEIFHNIDLVKGGSSNEVIAVENVKATGQSALPRIVKAENNNVLVKNNTNTDNTKDSIKGIELLISNEVTTNTKNVETANINTKTENGEIIKTTHIDEISNEANTSELSTSVTDVKADENGCDTIKEVELITEKTLIVDDITEIKNIQNFGLSDSVVTKVNEVSKKKDSNDNNVKSDVLDDSMGQNSISEAKETLKIKSEESIDKTFEVIESHEASFNLDASSLENELLENVNFPDNKQADYGSENLSTNMDYQQNGKDLKATMSVIQPEVDVSYDNIAKNINNVTNSLKINSRLTADQTENSICNQESTSETQDNMSRVTPSSSQGKLSEQVMEFTINENPIQANESGNELNNVKTSSIESETNSTSSSICKESNQENIDVEKLKHYDDTSDTLDNVSNISEGVPFEVDPTGTEKLKLGNINSSNGDSVDDTMDADLSSKNPMDLETAAVTIQKVFRSFMFKSRCSTFEESVNEETNTNDEESDEIEKQNEFATTYNKERRPLGISRMDTVLQTVNEEKSLSLSTDDSSLSSAATIIQAHVRGFLVRNRLNSNKSSSLVNSSGKSTQSVESDTDAQKNKTVLNIHIVPEGEHFMSRDESLLTSVDLSLDGSPPSSVNLHPLGYDKNEPRKQLKREDAIQSISPPSNNSGKMSEDSIKDSLIDATAEFLREEKTYCQIMADDIQPVSLPIERVNIINTATVENALINDITQQNEDETLSHRNEDISNIPNNINDESSKDNNDIENILKKKESVDNKFSTINLDDTTQAVLPTNSAFDNSEKNLDFVNYVSVKDTKGPHNDTEESRNQTGESITKSIDKENHKSDVEENDSLGTKHIVKQPDIAEPSINIVQSDSRKRSLTKMSSDESDVVTAFVKSTSSDANNISQMIHSGEFHDAVLPTKITRTDTSVVRGE